MGPHVPWPYAAAAKETMRSSIRTKLIVAILVPLLVVYLGVLAINYYTGRRQAIGQAKRHLTELVSNHAARLDGQFSASAQSAAVAAGLIADVDAPEGNRRIDVLLIQSMANSPVALGASVVLEPGPTTGDLPIGRYVYRAQPPAAPSRSPRRRSARGSRGPAGRTMPGPRPGREPPLRRGDLADIADSFHRGQWYLQAKAGAPAGWLEPARERIAAGRAVVRYVVPIRSDGTFRGALALDLDVERLQQYAAETRVEGGYCLLIGPSGMLIAHPQRELALRESLESLAVRQHTPGLEALAEKVQAGESGTIELDDFHTYLPSWVAYAPISSVGWSFAAAVPEEQILAPVRQWFRRGMAIMLGGLAVIIACVLLVSIRITRPIAHLARAVRDLAGGNLRAHARGVRSHDELGEFARAFNGMVRALRKHVNALTHETAARKAVESEIRVGRQIQQSLLPHSFPPFPHRPEFDLHAVIVPARQVAGDFFDFFFVRDDVLAFVIADVSGKGVPAALFMAVTRTVLRNQAIGGDGPAEVLNRANRAIADENDEMMFVTVFFGHYHTRTGQLVYANAGHNPPCIAAADGRVRRLDGSTGPILGVFPEKGYTERTAEMDPGDSLVLYTDGVTEALDESDRPFHLDRLEQIVANSAAATPEEICGLVVRTVEEHRTHHRQDDVTLLVLRRNNGAAR